MMDTPKQVAMARNAKVARQRATTALLAVYRLESGLRLFRLAVDGAVYGVARHKIDELDAANGYVSRIWTARSRRLTTVSGSADQQRGQDFSRGPFMGGWWWPRQDTHGRTDILRALEPVRFGGAVQRAPRARPLNGTTQPTAPSTSR